MIPLPMFCVLSAYELLTLPAYGRILFVLLTDSEFRSPFYAFIRAIGILDICHFAIEVAFFRLPMFAPTAALFGALPPSRAVTVGTFGVFFFSIPVFFLHTAVSLNRLTGIWLPTRHKKIWDHRVGAIICAALLFSLALCVHRLLSVGRFVPLIGGEPGRGYVPVVAEYDLYSFDQNLMMAVYSAACIVISLLTNAATLACIVRHHRTVKPALQQQQQSPLHRFEIHLYMVTAWNTLMLLLLAMFQTLVYAVRAKLLASPNLDVLFQSQACMEDICFLSQPWLLTLICSSIREKAFPFVGWKASPMPVKAHKQKIVVHRHNNDKSPNGQLSSTPTVARVPSRSNSHI